MIFWKTIRSYTNEGTVLDIILLWNSQEGKPIINSKGALELNAGQSFLKMFPVTVSLSRIFFNYSNMIIYTQTRYLHWPENTQAPRVGPCEKVLYCPFPPGSPLTGTLSWSRDLDCTWNWMVRSLCLTILAPVSDGWTILGIQVCWRPRLESQAGRALHRTGKTKRPATVMRPEDVGDGRLAGLSFLFHL